MNWNSMLALGNSFVSSLTQPIMYVDIEDKGSKVQILGPDEFLAPLCMLLIDKVTGRVVRQTLEEAQTTLALPIALLRRFSHPLQIQLS
ncbi:hypothetical protein EDD16DRAFT_1702626 [Pisolithus croceorrhizus]|nr:hypothetical protein EDD16DRAFT_1702626 [Pisolithus croceorrhizus]KAI6167609.1 hypothetical protein EDD17DRAFT_1750965 [Pisolithus thermaeus]